MKRILIAAVGLFASSFAHAQSESQLQYVCKDFVERSLHDPREADLQWTKGVVEKRKDGLWVVRFRGRAKNAYGALRLSTFECVIRYKGKDEFSAVSVRAL